MPPLPPGSFNDPGRLWVPRRRSKKAAGHKSFPGVSRALASTVLARLRFSRWLASLLPHLGFRNDAIGLSCVMEATAEKV